MAEKNNSITSTFEIKADGIELGAFTSSGIIVSTGSGSSGWLHGAKRITNRNVKEIAKEILRMSSAI